MIESYWVFVGVLGGAVLGALITTIVFCALAVAGAEEEKRAQTADGDISHTTDQMSVRL